MVEIAATMEISDADVVEAAALIAKVWPDYVDLFRREISIYANNKDVFEPLFVLAKRRGLIVGFGLLMTSMMSVDLLMISWVAVHADHRKRGIGRKVIDACLLEARQRRKPVVLATSTPDFYGRIGFDVVDAYHPEKEEFLLAYRKIS